MERAFRADIVIVIHRHHLLEQTTSGMTVNGMDPVIRRLEHATKVHVQQQRQSQVTATIKTSISVNLTLEFTVSGIVEKIGLLAIMVDTDAKNLAISVKIIWSILYNISYLKSCSEICL